MRTLFYSILTSCSFFFLGACQQEADIVLPEELSNDSTYISRVIALDTTKPSGSDTLTIYYYTYDQQKRLISIVERDLYGGIIRPAANYSIQYNGNDTLPTRYDFTNGSVHSSSFFSYAGSFVVKDSTSGFDGSNNYKQVTQVSQLRPGWFLMKSMWENDLDPGVFQTIDSTIFSRTYSAGNFVSKVDSVWNSGVFFYAEVRQSQYDRNKAPFWRFPLFFNGYYETVVPTLSFPTINNLITESVVNSSYGNTLLGASYEYRADGYPSMARISGLMEYNKYIFEYTHL